MTKLKLVHFIEQTNVDGLKAFCDDVLERELGETSIQELRKIAQRLGIPYYTTYPKATLLTLILEEKRKKCPSTLANSERLCPSVT